MATLKGCSVVSIKKFKVKATSFVYSFVGGGPEKEVAGEMGGAPGFW